MKRLLFCLPILGLWLIPACSAPATPNPEVVIETSMGTIKAELYEDKAPITVKNFLTYVDEKHYDGTIFHRVILDFMIQGGGFEPGIKERKGTHAKIRNEAGNGLNNVRGTLAMARTDDPDSATDQFFINVADNSQKLDRRGPSPGYAVFGKVISGMDVVDKIRTVQTGAVQVEIGGKTGTFKDVPTEDIIIKSIRRVEKKAEAK